MTGRWQPPSHCGACPDGARVRQWLPQPDDGWRAQPCGHTLADIQAALDEALATRLLPTHGVPQARTGPVPTTPDRHPPTSPRPAGRAQPRDHRHRTDTPPAPEIAMNDTSRNTDTAECILCPDDRRRLPRRPPACDACRSWLAGILGDIRIRFEEMTSTPAPVPDVRTLPVLLGNGRPAPLHDAVILAAPAGLIPGVPAGPLGRHVPESCPPTPLDPIDLASHVRAGAVHEKDRVPVIRTRPVEVLVRRVDVVTHEWEVRNDQGEIVTVRERVPVTVEEIQTRTERVVVVGDVGDPAMTTPQDQVGYLPVASVLDQWVRDWVTTRGRGEHLPVATVDVLTRWLANRVDWACDGHPAVDVFAAEMRELRSALNGVLGYHDWPTRKDAPCPKCDQRDLYVRNGSEWVECGSCDDVMLSPVEYAEWAKDVVVHQGVTLRSAGGPPLVEGGGSNT